MKGHSKNCSNLTTYYDWRISKCVLCPVEPGYEISPNCGLDDNGGRHERSHIECKANLTFNDGSSAYCKPCSSCPPGFNISSPCSTTTDTKCQDLRGGTSGDPVPKPSASQHVPTFSSTTIQTNKGPNLKPNVTPTTPLSLDVGLLGAVPLVIIISIIFATVSAFLIYRKWKKGQCRVLKCSGRSSYVNAGFSPWSARPGNNNLEQILNPNILSAPLQTVLDNLDVLEELVILLDPESHGVKNTKHLAYHCSFNAAWITYTYSMKDSKSPLKAVLEGVTSRNPDWTVGHLAKLLRQMERNDAIAVLAKLTECDAGVTCIHTSDCQKP